MKRWTKTEQRASLAVAIVIPAAVFVFAGVMAIGG